MARRTHSIGDDHKCENKLCKNYSKIKNKGVLVDFLLSVLFVINFLISFCMQISKQ